MSNNQYITVPIITNPDELAQVAYNRIAELVQGWEPSDGNFETILIEAIAVMMAEGRDIASMVPLAIFRYFGQTIMKILPNEATAAQALTDWKFADTKGYTVPAGTPIAISNAQGERFAFETLNEFSVAEGQSEVKGVQVIATIVGSESNKLKGLVEQAAGFPFVTTVSLNAATPETSGGADEESDTEYLNRLASELSLLAPRPITTKDYALIATNIEGIHRALAINGYNPENSTEGNERCVAVSPIDLNGNPVSSAVKAALKAYLEEIREVNFLPFVFDPTYTEVDVTITVHAIEGSSKVAVEAIVKKAIESFLSPANWGLVTTSGIPLWRNEPVVRQGSIAAVANQNIGVAYPLLPTIAVHAGVLESKDLVLPGKAPLPKPGTITVNVLIP